MDVWDELQADGNYMQECELIERERAITGDVVKSARKGIQEE